MANDKQKPLLFAKAPSNVERHHRGPDDPRQYRGAAEPPEQGWDAFYVPGFSDIRKLNELAKLKGEPQIPLPANVAWVRATGDTRDHYSGAQKWFRDGYKIVTDATTDANGQKRSQTLEDMGYGAPPAATVTREGNFRIDDTILAWCPAEKYEEVVRKHADKRRALKEATSGQMTEMVRESSEKIAVGAKDAMFPKRD